MWSYYQNSGLLVSEDGLTRYPCYAGKGVHKNDPDSQHIPDQGPLPCGLYKMRELVDTEKHGPDVIWLDPDPSNDMFGRAGFGIHGDSIAHPGEASEGCIVTLSTEKLHARQIRQHVWNSGDHDLRVFPFEPKIAVAVDPSTEAE